MNKKIKLFILHAVLFILGIIVGFAKIDKLFAIPLTNDPLPSSLSRSIQQELNFPNDEKKLVVQRMEHKKDKNITLLHGIQIIDEENEGRNYYVQDDYEERNFICRAFNFEGAFNEIDDENRSLKTPIVALGTAHRTMKFDDEERDRLVPYKKSHESSVSRLEVLPCRMKSS